MRGEVTTAASSSGGRRYVSPRIVKVIALYLDDDTFTITLHTGQTIEGRIGEPLRLDGTDVVVPTCYGEF